MARSSPRFASGASVDRVRAPTPGGNSASSVGSEEVADRELEVHRLLVGQRHEREAPLETQRPEWREPANAEARRRAQIREAREREARRHHLVELRRGRGPAELILRVPRVAHVVEDDATNADLVDDRELEL